MEIVAGIDPGLSGAVAVVNSNADCFTARMPVMGKPPIVDGAALVGWLADYDVTIAVVEQAQAFPEQGVSSVFRYGMVFGQVIGVLQAALIPYRLVTPRRWKRDLNLTRDKEVSRRRAIETFPRHAAHFALKKDEARAEAALIAWWWLAKQGKQREE
jgi:crossover junction endodeoxyribonuclease RuvC